MIHLRTKDKTVNEHHDNHPNHPANQAELVARFGYISPNQFPEDSLIGVGYFDNDGDSKIDEQLDIEEAEKAAKFLADELGQSVTVDVTDENGESLDPLTFDAPSAEIEL